MNTPQFDWARHRLPRKPQPVAPVYQPEVAASAVYRAAQNSPRELWVGGSTIKAILGGMAVPAYVDRLLARVATKSQISNDREEPDPQDNLFTPVGTAILVRMDGSAVWPRNPDWWSALDAIAPPSARGSSGYGPGYLVTRFCAG